MKAFMVLCFVAVASAGRLGYNYQPGSSGSSEYVSSGSGVSPVLALGGAQASNQGSGVNFSPGSSGIGGGYGEQAQGSGISYGLSGGSIGSGLGAGIGYGSGSQSIGSGIGYGSGSIGSGIGGGLGSGISYGSGSVGSGIGGGLGSGSISSGLSGGASYGGAVQNQVVDGGLTKEYYIFSAPEEEVRQGQNTQSVSTYLKKNLRVIFIKAPENNGVHNAALQVARQATEDKTAIYVLSKEPDVSEIANQVQQISENVRAKPEVRFIKYRTVEDALNAQRTIQQQYEALGGTSQSSNEGVAPVLNFASPAAVHQSGHAHGQGHAISGGSNLIASGSSINSAPSGISSPVLDFASASEQSSQSVNSGNSGASSKNVVVKSEKEYLPPAVKK